MAREIRKVGVVGAGAMGSGIVHILALGGVEVVMRDLTEQKLERAQANITHMLDRTIERGGVQADHRSEILRRIDKTTRLGEVRSCDLIIEAIVEVEESKFELVAELNEICSPETIIATNTNTVSITSLGTFSRRPDRLLGTHFLHPVATTRLVEIVRGVSTSQDTIDRVTSLMEKVGRVPVLVQDSPGFVLNRLMAILMNEAAFMLQEGVADAPSIDVIMRQGNNLPLGPLAMADAVGLDTLLKIIDALHRDLGDDKYRPCPLLRRMVRAGHYGRKSGRGFYSYEQHSRP